MYIGLFISLFDLGDDRMYNRRSDYDTGNRHGRYGRSNSPKQYRAGDVDLRGKIN